MSLIKGVLVGVTFIKSLLIFKIERFVKFGKSCREFCILWNSVKINWYNDSKNLKWIYSILKILCYELNSEEYNFQ